jgi:hypothetical protein
VVFTMLLSIILASSLISSWVTQVMSALTMWFSSAWAVTPACID